MQQRADVDTHVQIDAASLLHCRVRMCPLENVSLRWLQQTTASSWHGEDQHTYWGILQAIAQSLWLRHLNGVVACTGSDNLFICSQAHATRLLQRMHAFLLSQPQEISTAPLPDQSAVLLGGYCLPIQ